MKQGDIMMAVNTYGLKMVDLSKTAGETRNLRGYYTGVYHQLNYNTATGEIWTDYHYSIGQNTWSQYNDADIINIGNICNPTTMQGIADMIHNAIDWINNPY